MKKIIISLFIIGLTTTINAQWTNTDGDITTTGSVGIGTTSPSEKLEVNGTTKTTNLQINGGVTKYAIPSITGGWQRGMIFYNSNDFDGVKLGGFGMYGSASEAKRLFMGFGNNPYNSTLGLQILNDGSVGVGTASPTSKLHVNGETRSTSMYLVGRTADALDNGWRQTYVNWIGHSLIFGTKEGSYAHNVIEMKPGGSDRGGLTSVFKMHYAASPTEHDLRVNIDSRTSYPSYFNVGNIGIGTASPTSKLQVNGDFNINEELFIDVAKNVETTNGTTKQYSVLRQNNPQKNIAFKMDGDDGTDRFSFMTDFGSTGTPTERMVIMAQTGNVGIGTTDTGDYKLAVAGSTGIIAEKVTVKLYNNGWPDYVFEEDYDLPSLEEVEKHIKEKGHLENIPSAKQMEESDGIDLGAMNTKLLQKIEELTLYTIQQEKRIKSLKSIKDENLILKNRLKEIEAFLKTLK